MSKKSELYKINYKIGNGGQGTVFNGTRLDDSYQVAIKKIECDGIESINTNLEEILIIKNLKHKNIINYIDFYFEELGETTFLCLVMNYFANGDLSTYMKKNTINEKQTINFIIQISSALSFLHDNNIIHCDLKPVNKKLNKRKTFLLKKRKN
jgi:p21-activated kinase 1